MKKSILFILFLLSISCSVFGQVRISGRVVDYDGALAGVMIQIKGTQMGTLTDLEGNFSLLVSNSEDILVFSYEGLITKELQASQVNGDIALEHPLTICYMLVPYKVLKINYWSGLFYNPYGLSFAFTAYHFPRVSYVHFASGYSTNFNQNYDVFGEIGTRILSRKIHYKFQQTTFQKSEIENQITTHLLESSSDIKIASFLYGVGHQTFSKKGIEDSQTNNYGIYLGLSKNIKYIGNISAKSFYWQDYWAWEANLDKSIYFRKLRLNTAISYRQTTQDFKEVNLILGYMF